MDGWVVGTFVGDTDGVPVGVLLGCVDGVFEGCCVGETTGALVGSPTRMGDSVGPGVQTQPCSSITIVPVKLTRVVRTNS
jgi:hypothetical protein